METTSSYKVESYKVKRQNIISLLIVFIFIVFGFLLISKSSDVQYVTLGGENIKVELAQTPDERAQGLSGRKNLAKDTGLLFIFEKPGHYPFWMKDMNFPIDIIWISRNREIVFIEKNATPKSYPKNFGGEVESSYVLEVIAGFADKHNLAIGDQVEFGY